MKVTIKSKLIVVARWLFSADFRESPVGRVFANGPGDRGLIPGRVIPKL